MPQNEPDLDAMIRAIVADELSAAMAPLRSALERLAASLSAAGEIAGEGLDAPRRPQATPKARQAGSVPRSRALAPAARAPTRGVAALRPGQKVRYLDGGGEREAVIEAIEPESGDLLLVGADGVEAIRSSREVVLASAPVAGPRQVREPEPPEPGPDRGPAGATPRVGDPVVFEVAESRLDGVLLEIDPENAIALVERKDNGRTTWCPLGSVQLVPELPAS